MKFFELSVMSSFISHVTWLTGLDFPA